MRETRLGGGAVAGKRWGLNELRVAEGAAQRRVGKDQDGVGGWVAMRALGGWSGG